MISRALGSKISAIAPKNYFWNASGSHEIDLLLDKGGQLLPVEIKSSRTIRNHFSLDTKQVYIPDTLEFGLIRQSDETTLFVENTQLNCFKYCK